MADNSLIHSIRFGPEKDLIDDIVGRFQLEAVLQQFETSDRIMSFYDEILGSQLRLTPVLAPRLCSLLEEAREKTGFQERVDLFVVEDAEIQAYAVPSTAEDAPSLARPSRGSRVSGALVRCPHGEIDDPYPGLCRHYVDANGNGYCDFSQVS